MGVGGQRHNPAALPPGKTRYLLYRRPGGPQGRAGRVRKISPPPGFDPRTIQPVASRYTDWATPARQKYNTVINTWFYVTLQGNSKYALKHARQPVLHLRKLTLRNLRTSVINFIPSTSIVMPNSPNRTNGLQ